MQVASSNVKTNLGWPGQVPMAWYASTILQLCLAAAGLLCLAVLNTKPLQILVLTVGTRFPAAGLPRSHSAPFVSQGVQVISCLTGVQP